MKAPLLKKSKNIEFFSADASTEIALPFAEAISAGFPSPAAEYLELTLDLNKELVNNPSSTFYGRVKGNSMIGAGIHDGDILVIDKSLEPANNKKAVCFIDGEFTIKTLKVAKGEVWLKPENKDYAPIKITPENDFMVWGIVTHIIHKA
jgi:DNA polymerase V